MPGGADLSVRYYANDMVVRLSQATDERAFTLDPAGRLRGLTESTDGLVTRSTLNHYAGPGDNPSWWTQTTTCWPSRSMTAASS